MSSVGWEFEKHAAAIDESERDGETPEQYVRRLARGKASAVAERFPNGLVLGADTTVVVGAGILGKPSGLDDARRMLEMLSGRSHIVLTGVAVAHNGRVWDAVEATTVNFCEMSADEIEYLAEKGDPLDKAGAYAVQAQAALFISGIEGDYWNVVGLPVQLVYRLIKKSLHEAGLRA